MDASTPTAASSLAPIVFVAHGSHRVLDAMSGAAHGLAAVAGAGEPGTFLRRTSHKLADIVPLWTIGVGALDATDGVMQAGGMHGLAATESGRRGVLDVLGGALMLVPHPVARAASAGLFATSIANDLGAFSSLGGPDAGAAPHP